MPKTKKTTPKQKKPTVRIPKKTIKSTVSKKVKEPLKEDLRFPTGQAKIKKEKYFEGVGRRKTSTARVRLFPQKEKSFFITRAQRKAKRTSSSSPDEKTLEKYFPTRELQLIVLAPLNLMNCLEQFKVSVKVKGGGVVSQAEAVRHGIARALVLFNLNFRKRLKKAGYLKRDPRMRERKKFGLKRARRAPQWSKR